MNPALFFTSLAESDVRSAASWYEDQRKALSDEFRADLDRVTATILENPQAFPKIRGRCRRALMKRFPYGVFYLLEARGVVVLAVTHTSRNPKTWQSRLRIVR